MTTVLRWELRKLAAQWRARGALLVCLLGPFAFAGVLALQDSVPADTLFGRDVHTSGYALPLVALGFCGTWAFPLLASVVAADVFAGEDGHGTWAALVTRGRSRSTLFTGKVLAAAVFGVVAMVVLTASSLLAGLALAGSHPLSVLDGATLGPGRLVGLVLLAWLTALLPFLAFSGIAVLVAVATRQSTVAVVGPFVLGLLMQLLSLAGIRVALLSSAFEGWHGLLAQASYTGPLVTGLVVSAVYLAVSLALAWRLLLRRSFA